MTSKAAHFLYNTRLGGWVLLILLMLTWGSSFILMKRGLEVYSSVQVGAIRIFMAFLVLLPVAIRHIGRIPRSKLKYIFVVGLLGTGLPAFLFAKAQTGLDSAVAGILNSLMPLFTLLAGLAFFGQKTRAVNVAGILIGLAGAIGLIYVTGRGTLEFRFSYAIYIVIATVFYAIQSNMIKYYLNDVKAAAIAAVGFFFIGIPAGILLFFFTDFTQVIVSGSHATMAFVYIAMLGIFGSAIAIIFYNKLVQTTTAIFASMVTYFVPVVALLWGMADGERFPASAFGFAAVILLGVVLVNRRKNHNASNKKSKKTFAG
jgi:drug/metabolite transporter (DMT)-like permease